MKGVMPGHPDQERPGAPGSPGPRGDSLFGSAVGLALALGRFRGARRGLTYLGAREVHHET
jgi:hypothetical protein